MQGSFGLPCWLAGGLSQTPYIPKRGRDNWRTLIGIPYVGTSPVQCHSHVILNTKPKGKH